MLVLDIAVELGPRATPAQLEVLLQGVRVATDVGRYAQLRQIRRTATEQMKFPTDDELRAATNRFPEGDDTGLAARLRRHLDLRENLDQMAPPEFWFEWRHRRDRQPDKLLSRFKGTGFERTWSGALLPWAAGASAGLEVIDPLLYQALVADEVARLAPGQVTLREVHYRNPLEAGLAAVGATTSALEKAAGVIDTTATLGSRRKIKRAEADVAEATVEDRIDESRLDVELKREALRRARLENELADEQLLAMKIQNAQALNAFSIQPRQQALADHFLGAGKLDEADVIRELDPTDAESLIELGKRAPELEQHYEPDPPDD